MGFKGHRDQTLHQIIFRHKFIYVPWIINVQLLNVYKVMGSFCSPVGVRNRIKSKAACN